MMNVNFNLNDNRSANLWAERIGKITQNADDKSKAERTEDVGSSKSSSMTSQTTRIEKILSLQSESSAYSDAGKDDEAYGLLSKLYKLGPTVSHAPILINYYKTLLKTQRDDESDKVRSDLTEIVRNEIRSTPKECEVLGDKFRSEEEYFKSILFYKISAALLADKTDAAETLIGLQGCVLGMKLCAAQLLKSLPSCKSFLVDRVLPSMRQMKCQVQNVAGIDKKAVSLTVGVCLHHIENTEMLVGDMEAREETLRESISYMRDNLGEEAKKFHIYGAALNNLGATLLHSERAKAAADFFTEAIEVNMAAEDYSTEAERKDDVKKSESALQQAEDAIKLLST